MGLKCLPYSENKINVLYDNRNHKDNNNNNNNNNNIIIIIIIIIVVGLYTGTDDVMSFYTSLNSSVYAVCILAI